MCETEMVRTVEVEDRVEQGQSAQVHRDLCRQPPFGREFRERTRLRDLLRDGLEGTLRPEGVNFLPRDIFPTISVFS